MHFRCSTRTRVLATGLILLLLLATLDASAGRKRRGRQKANLDYALPGTVEVLSTTHGAIVEIDGRVVGNIPLEDELAVEPGQHTIRVHLRGWTEHTDSFVVKPGQDVELEIDLLPIAGIVRITTSEPGASVKLNDRVIGVTPFDQDIPVGEATVMLTHPGFEDHLQSLNVQAGQSYDLNIDLIPLPAVTLRESVEEMSVVRSWWFWTAVAVVVAGGTATVIMLADPPRTAPRCVEPGIPLLLVGNGDSTGCG